MGDTGFERKPCCLPPLTTVARTVVLVTCSEMPLLLSAVRHPPQSSVSLRSFQNGESTGTVGAGLAHPGFRSSQYTPVGTG